VAALSFLPGAARADEPLPPDLAFVPADGLGFAHVRLREVWHSPLFKVWRDTIHEAGDQALKAFDRRFVPAPFSLERVTIVVLPPTLAAQLGNLEPQVIAILRTSRPIDREAFFKYTFPGSKEEKAGGKSLHVGARDKMGVVFLDDRTLAFGQAPCVREALAKPPARQGTLSEALTLANSGKAIVAAVNGAALVPLVAQHLPEQFLPLAKARLVTLALDLGERGHITVRLTYPLAEDAAEAERVAEAGIKEARSLLAKQRDELQKKVVGDGKPGRLNQLPEAAAALFAVGGLKRLDHFLARPPLTREGSSLQVAFDLPQAGPESVAFAAVGVGLFLPAVQKVREAAGRTQDANNLKQLALAMHNYASATGGAFPPAAICDPSGKPLLSWRVALLPYLEHQDLYQKFRLNEPWDSPHNHKLLALMPEVYRLPAAPAQVGQTHYRVFYGNGAILNLDRPTRLADITDGTSNTLLIVETAQSVPWTKPEDIHYDPNGPLPPLASFFAGGFNAAFADGSVRFFRTTPPQEVLRALITRAGGEPVDPESLK
jgi:prepilin-type processing-associated H-X9-DG protein